MIKLDSVVFNKLRNRRILQFSIIFVSLIFILACSGEGEKQFAGENEEIGSDSALDILDHEQGEIKLTFLGTGAPRPSNERFGPAILIEAAGFKVMVDAGSGVRERLFEAGGFELITSVDHFLVTHLHFDHTISIPGLWLSGWLYGRKSPVYVFGPEGTSEMMNHLQDAYDWDIRYRHMVGVHKEGSTIVAVDVEEGEIFNKNGLVITAFPVEHMPIDMESGELLGLEGATLGYRIDYNGHSVLFSGDTRSTPKSPILDYGKGVDVLIHEVQVPSKGDSPEAKLANVSLSVHSTPAQAAYVFKQSKPRMAVYSHIIPPNITEEELIQETRHGYEGPLTVAFDLMTMIVGDEIRTGIAKHEGTEVFEESKVVK